MTTTETVNGQTFTVTRLPAEAPKKSDLIFSRVGGAKSRFYAATGSGRNGRQSEKRQQRAARLAT